MLGENVPGQLREYTAGGAFQAHLHIPGAGGVCLRGLVMLLLCQNGTGLFTQAAADAGCLIHHRITKSILVGRHGDASLWTDRSTSCTAGAGAMGSKQTHGDSFLSSGFFAQFRENFADRLPDQIFLIVIHGKTVHSDAVQDRIKEYTRKESEPIPDWINLLNR